MPIKAKEENRQAQRSEEGFHAVDAQAFKDI